MSTKANHFKIGLFVIAAAIVLVVGVVLLGAGRLFRTRILAETYINESVNGLDIGSPIKYRGVQIGSVRDIDFVHRVYGETSGALDAPRLSDDLSSPALAFRSDAVTAPDAKSDDDRTRWVLVRFVIFPDSIGYKGDDLRSFLREEIGRGLRVRLSAQGITGMFYLEVDYTKPIPTDTFWPTWAPESFYIPSVSSPFQQFTQILNEGMNEIDPKQIGSIIKNVDRMSKTLSVFIDALDGTNLSGAAIDLMTSATATVNRFNGLLGSSDTAQTLSNLANLTSDTAGIAASLRPHAGRLAEKATAAAADLAGASASVRDMADRLNEKLDAMRGLDTLADKITSAALTVSQSMDDFNRTVRRLDRMISTEEQSVQEIFENVRAFSRDLKNFGEQARRYPSQVFFGDPPTPVDPTLNEAGGKR